LLSLLAIGYLLTEFTAVGQLYQIRRTAQSYLLKGGIDGNARIKLALAQIRWNYHRDAERTLDGMLNPVDKVKGLSEAAEEWNTVGRREEADRAIGAASEVNKQVQRLPELIDGYILIAKAAYKIRGMDTSNRLLAKAFGKTLSLSSAQEIMDELIAISSAYRVIGDSDAADEILDQAPEYIAPLKDASDKSVAMRDLAIALGQLSRFDAADGIAEGIPDSFQKALALAGVADALNRMRNTREAGAMLDKAARISNQIGDVYYQDRVRSEIASLKYS
jgi:tetratricopeptide (TPR) repeat protein